jgi:hypothetical protein
MNLSTMAVLATRCFVIVVVSVVAAVALAVLFASRRPGEARRTAVTRAVVVVGALGGWLALTYRIGSEGALLDFSGTPPRFAKMVAVVSLSTVILALSPVGRRLVQALPIACLVGFHAVRLPVELILHALWKERLIPVQMTFEGLNFDIVTGLSALGVAYFVQRGKLRSGAILVWNTVGLLLLVAIVVVANLSTPAFRCFASEPKTVLLATAPFVWLPMVLVQAVLFAHVLTFRAIAQEARVRRLHRRTSLLSLS